MEQPAAPSPVPVPDKKTANGAATGDAQGSSVGKTGHTPPYWGRHMRSISNVSYTSVQGSSRPQPIILEDNTEPEQQRSDAGKGLWARGVSIHDHVVVAGSAIGTGAYVVWVCKVDTLEVCLSAFASATGLEANCNEGRLSRDPEKVKACFSHYVNSES